MTPIYIVASLWIHEGAESAFEVFEKKAARTMKKYEGQIERTIRAASGPSPDQPFEVHIIRFPSQEMFEAYRADQELKALLPERNLAISRTEILIGYERQNYAS